MKLYVIRHGQSQTNETRCYTGWSQVLLTQKGIDSAKSIRPLLENVTFDKIYSSDLIRAKQTLEAVLPGSSFEETPLLREIGMGSWENQPIASYSPEDKAVGAKVGYDAWDGESRADFRQRIRDFMALAENSGCETVAAFSHRGWLMGMLDEVIGVQNTGGVTCNNCAVAVFTCTDGIWRLYSWINSF